MFINRKTFDNLFDNLFERNCTLIKRNQHRLQTVKKQGPRKHFVYCKLAICLASALGILHQQTLIGSTFSCLCTRNLFMPRDATDTHRRRCGPAHAACPPDLHCARTEWQNAEPKKATKDVKKKLHSVVAS